MQIALNDEEVGAIIESLYKSLSEVRNKISVTQDPELRAVLRYREGVLRHLVDHVMSGVSIPRAA